MTTMMTITTVMIVRW